MCLTMASNSSVQYVSWSDMLFQDIHYMALDKGETALAEVARRKAEQVDSESLGIKRTYQGYVEDLT